MIYTLTNTIHKQISWQDVIYEQDYLDIKNIYHNTNTDNYIYFGEYLNNKDTFNKLLDIPTDSILLIDDSYLMIENNSNYTLEIIDKISKLDCKTIVFSKNSTITDSLNTEKCTIFSPKITNPYHGLLLNSFNPGLINSSHVTTYHAIDKILNEFKDIPKYKKFNFIANDMSPQWVFIYILMKKNGY